VDLSRPQGVGHREVYDEINPMLTAPNREINGHIHSGSQIDHANAADTAAQLGAVLLRHAYIHGQVDSIPAFGPDDSATSGPADERQ